MKSLLIEVQLRFCFTDNRNKFKIKICFTFLSKKSRKIFIKIDCLACCQCQQNVNTYKHIRLVLFPLTRHVECFVLISLLFSRVWWALSRTDAPLEKKYIQKQRKNAEKMEIRLKCVNESCFRFVLKKCVCVNSKANV